MSYLRGIDISRFEATIDTDHIYNTKIENLPSDIRFAAIKASQGATEHDPAFQDYYHNFKIKQPEVIIFPYHFFDWKADPILQAKNLLSRNINFNGSGTGPLMLDLEGDGSIGDYVINNKAICIQRVNDFINYLRNSKGQIAGENYGRNEIIIYSFDNFIKENLGGHIWADTIFWVSSFQPNPPPILPGWPYKFWQYSQFGQITGLATNGNLDLDYFLGTESELNQLANITST